MRDNGGGAPHRAFLDATLPHLEALYRIARHAPERDPAKVGPLLGIGVVYGVVWWVLGALVVMPLQAAGQRREIALPQRGVHAPADAASHPRRLADREIHGRTRAQQPHRLLQRGTGNLGQSHPDMLSPR